MFKFIALGCTAFALFSCIGANNIKSKPENMETTTETKASFYDFKMKSIDGKEIDFAQYKGKKVLLVNVASKCGYTPQYDELQKLHEQYGDKVVILGFPANNFGGQEPGKNDEIAAFCKKNYGVTFQLFEKISVKGDDMHPLYQWLSDKSKNGWNDQAPTWNFCKYLINEKGELVKFFGSGVKPLGDEMKKAIGIA
jgi:glutathione peroxidase